jgi:hypothetical protein
MAKPLATGTLIKKRDKSSPRWVPEGLFTGSRPIPKKPY